MSMPFFAKNPSATPISSGTNENAPGAALPTTSLSAASAGARPNRRTSDDCRSRSISDPHPPPSLGARRRPKNLHAVVLHGDHRREQRRILRPCLARRRAAHRLRPAPERRFAGQHRPLVERQPDAATDRAAHHRMGLEGASRDSAVRNKAAPLAPGRASASTAASAASALARAGLADEATVTSPSAQ